MAVQFYYRRTYLGDMALWHKLGTPITTDSNGAATLSSLAPLLDSSCFPGKYQTERDLQLKAVVSLSKGKISDNLGRIRILGVDPGQNNATILSDHDNTLHKTGGTNTVEDIADSANVMNSTWPLMESTVQPSVKGWLADSNDFIIITGQTDPISPKCREQVGLHFENNGERKILIINSSDVPVSGGANVFKATAIKIIMGLYGKTNIEAMVGDTVSQDGYGALANGVTYIPYHVNSTLNSLVLDTKGYGKIASTSVLWKWDAVIAEITANKH